MFEASQYISHKCLVWMAGEPPVPLIQPSGQLRRNLPESGIYHGLSTPPGLLQG